MRHNDYDMRRARSHMASMVALAAVAIGIVATPSPAKANARHGFTRIEIPKDATPFAYLVADKAGNRMSNPSIRDVSIDGKRYLVMGAGTDQVACAAWNSPAPTHSPSTNNMSYGTQVLCDFPIPVKAKSVVYSGPDDNHLYTWQADTGWKFGVQSVWAGSHNGLCVEPTEDLWQWQLLGYAQGDTNLDGVFEQFYPYPGDARKPNYCADMV